MPAVLLASRSIARRRLYLVCKLVNFVAVGLSHKTAPVEIREQVFIPEAGVGECVRRLVDRDLIESGMLLSTCNRTELYAVASPETAPHRLLESFGLGPPAPALAPGRPLAL